MTDKDICLKKTVSRRKYVLANVKIRSKLFIAFGLFVVLMMVSSGLSLLSLDRSNSGMQNIITTDYPITVKANLLIDNFQEIVSTQQLMLLDEEGKWTQASQKARYHQPANFCSAGCAECSASQ
jgi:methyl-accepting chemotaxis protein-2 (aspartate sensor receptor)